MASIEGTDDVGGFGVRGTSAPPAGAGVDGVSTRGDGVKGVSSAKGLAGAPQDMAC